MSREIKIAKDIIKSLELDLTGLMVMTECANGGYAFTPIIAALAGANVIAVGRDTRYGLFQENIKAIKKIAANEGRDSNIQFVHSDQILNQDLSNVNVVTNSGMLRPIQASLIEKLSPICVIPLMWETWEFRDADLDIKACQENKVAVIGTNEKYPKVNMFGYNAFLVLKLLFDLKLEAYNNNIVLLGGGISGKEAFKGLKQMGLKVKWFSSDKHEGSIPYDQLPHELENFSADAMINFEHSDHSKIIGEKGVISFEEILKMCPEIRYGHICGNIEQTELENSKIDFLPNQILPAGYMSYETQNLGNRPVLELCAMGLKVGEIGARERLSGATIEQAIQSAVHHGIGQDFTNGFLNYGK